MEHVVNTVQINQFVTYLHLIIGNSVQPAETRTLL